ncbi:MAG: ParA family protein [Clostridia bacterium]|nr:ParA family protein [Clostridia bacterium]
MNQTQNVTVIMVDYDQSRMNDLYYQIVKSSPFITVIATSTDSIDLKQKLDSMEPDAIFMQYHMNDCNAVDIEKYCREKDLKTMVFATLPSQIYNVNTVMYGKRNGIKEIFSSDTVSPQEVGMRIVDTVHSFRKEYEKITGQDFSNRVRKEIVTKHVTKVVSQRIIVTYNTKGGVGKTTIAVNLTIAIKQSPYFSGKRIALLDFDSGGGNVSTICNVDDEELHSKNLAAWDSIEENEITRDIIEDLMIQDKNGIMILAVPLNLVQAKNATKYELGEKIINGLKKHFDIIIIDGPPNISPLADAALEAATDVLLVANPEGQSIKQLTKLTSLLNNIEDGDRILKKMYLLVNQAHKPTKYDMKLDRISGYLGKPILRYIPNCDEVLEALHSNGQKQAIEINKEGEYAKAMKGLANDLTGCYPVGDFDAETAKEKKKRKKSFFGIFGG